VSSQWPLTPETQLSKNEKKNLLSLQLDLDKENFETESVSSYLSNNSAEDDDIEDENGSQISNSDYHISDNVIIRKSVTDPNALVGWRVNVKDYGSGVILAIKKKKFSTTKFSIHFENGSIRNLPLKRSEKKGKIQFTLLSKLN